MRKKRTNEIKSKPTFAVLVEGETEVWYFNMLVRNERKLSVTIKPELPHKKSLKEQFALTKELAEDYFKVFWIVDLDVINKETKEGKKGEEKRIQVFLKYRNELIAHHKNVTVIVNNPCLEYWFLVHYDKTTKHFDTCASAEKQLKKHLKDYEKTKDYFTKQDNDIYLKLRDNLITAIENAKRIGSFNEKEPSIGMTEMDLFFDSEELKIHFR